MKIAIVTGDSSVQHLTVTVVYNLERIDSKWHVFRGELVEVEAFGKLVSLQSLTAELKNNIVDSQIF